MTFIKKNFIVIIGIVAGAIGGYMYYHFVGCNGQCLISSSPYISTLYGGVMGALIVNMFQKDRATGKAG